MMHSPKRNNRGVTITSLTIYVIVATIIVGVLTFLNAQFFSNINELTKESNIQSKDLTFKAYFLRDVKGNVEVSDFSDNIIKLNNSVTYEVRMANNSAASPRYAIYRNDVKISDQVIKYVTPLGEMPFFSYDKDVDLIRTAWQYSDGGVNYIENLGYAVGNAKSNGNREIEISEASLNFVDVIYHSNDGTNATKKQYVVVGGTSSKVLANQFTRLGYTLEGYSSTASGDIEFEVGDILDGSVRHLYAVWEVAMRESTYCAGEAFQTAVKRVDGVDNDLSAIKRIVWSTKDAYQQNASKAGNLASDGNPIYAWYDSSNETLYLYSISTTIKLPANCENMFNGFTGLTNFNLRNDLNITDFSLVTNTSSMFANCTSLVNLDLSGFSAASVTNMSQMFKSCTNLSVLNIPNFTTNLCEDFSEMFYNCNALTTVDFTNINTDKAVTTARMFRNCTALTSLDLSHLNTTELTNASDMFRGCSGLTSIDVSSFNTSIVTNFNSMFRGCSSLTSLNLDNFNTNMGTDFEGMFADCTNLVTISAKPTFNVKSNAESGDMFIRDTKLVGGSGTTYNSSKVNGVYAWIDGSLGREGYFTGPIQTVIRYVYNDGTDRVDEVTYENNVITAPGAPYYRENYDFRGWSFNVSGQVAYRPNTEYTMSSVTVYGVWETDVFNHLAAVTFDGNNVVDTNVRLFSENNWQTNFDLSFVINEVGSNNAYQATIMNCKDENSGPYYYGIAMRVENTKYYTSSNATKQQEYRDYFTMAPNTKFHFIRINKKLYLSVNDAPFTFICDYTNFSHYFDVPVTLGGSVGPDYNYFRFFKGTISNIHVQLSNSIKASDYIFNEDASIDQYDEMPMVFYRASGEFDSTAAHPPINTGICLFSTENRDKDFKVSFIIDHMDTYSSQATMMNSNNEDDGSYPGFKVRMSSATKIEISAKAGASLNPQSATLTNGLKISIYRIDHKLYVEYNDNRNLIQFADFTAWSRTHSFNIPVYFGSSWKNGAKQRCFDGVLREMTIRLADDDDD